MKAARSKGNSERPRAGRRRANLISRLSTVTPISGCPNSTDTLTLPLSPAVQHPSEISPLSPSFSRRGDLAPSFEIIGGLAPAFGKAGNLARSFGETGNKTPSFGKARSSSPFAKGGQGRFAFHTARFSPRRTKENFFAKRAKSAKKRPFLISLQFLIPPLRPLRPCERRHSSPWFCFFVLQKVQWERRRLAVLRGHLVHLALQFDHPALASDGQTVEAGQFFVQLF